MTWLQFLYTYPRIRRLFLVLSFIGTAGIFALVSNLALKHIILYLHKDNGQHHKPKLILNTHSFPYLILEDDLCAARYPNVFLVILIHSSVDHIGLRMSVRTTWGSRYLYDELGIVTVFLLGRPNPNTRWKNNITAAILRESSRFRDIIQEDFIDSYRNLTYKAVSGLRWITKFCQNSMFVLKADDDEFVNIYRLVYYLRVIYMTNPGINSLVCMKWDKLTPIKDNSSKWYINNIEYNKNVYPPFCSGSAFIMPTRIVPSLYNSSFYRPFFWVDDVFVTGMLTQDSNVSLINIPPWYVFSERVFEKRLVYGDSVFGNHHPSLSTKKRAAYWKKIMLREEYNNRFEPSVI